MCGHLVFEAPPSLEGEKNNKIIETDVSCGSVAVAGTFNGH